MAYADATHTNRKLGTLAAVTLIEAGLAYAVITGLMMKIERNPDTVLTTFNSPKPKDPPQPPPPEARHARKDPTRIDRPDVLVKLPPNAGSDLTSDAGADGGSEIGDVTFPLPDVTPPVPPTPPAFTPKRAAPRGNTAKWVTTNDYPANDLRAEHQGRTSYRLAIDAGGAVSDCTVTTSSGWPGLDKAVCDNVRRRAKFEPATDQTGARTAGWFSGAVTWQIPEE